MAKSYKQVVEDIVNKMNEEAPANAVAHGGVDMNPTGKKAKLKKQKDDVLRRMGAKIKENNDNNNVVLKSVNEQLNKIEDKIDEKSGIKKEELRIKPVKQTFHDKFIKDLATNTPHVGQFDEDI